MGVKSIAARLLARLEMQKLRRWRDQPQQSQLATLSYLCENAAKSTFGKDHHIHANLTPEDWKMRVPLRDYEGLKPYINRVVMGEADVMWPGRPLYLCKTSGTTSGVKYIPMTDHGIKAQIKAAKRALLAYVNETGKAGFVDGKMIFLQGSPVMEMKNGLHLGRLSGIVAHHVPKYLQSNRLPSWSTNCIEDWDTKVTEVVDETKHADLRLVSGIPPWVQMYFERLIAQTGKNSVSEVFPKLSLLVHGGVNYKPYEASMRNLIGIDIDSVETYPASEGFIAFQDSQKDTGLLLNLDAGIYYEFIPMDQFYSELPMRLSLWEVELDVNYAIALNTSSGLFGYIIGDTVKFTSLKPYKIRVTGRVKHFISAFGEHVIAEEVERAMSETIAAFNMKVNEFHVAPQVAPIEGGLPYHEWFLESSDPVPEGFDEQLDAKMRQLNVYYDDLIKGHVLRPLVLRVMPTGTFNAYMSSIGKLGGQNKLPRLSNDRNIANSLV